MIPTSFHLKIRVLQIKIIMKNIKRFNCGLYTDATCWLMNQKLSSYILILKKWKYSILRYCRKFAIVNLNDIENIFNRYSFNRIIYWYEYHGLMMVRNNEWLILHIKHSKWSLSNPAIDAKFDEEKRMKLFVIFQ